MDAVNQCRPLRTQVKSVLKWQRLMRDLKVRIPTVPKTRWIYIVEVLQVLASVPDLETLLEANPRAVRRQLGCDARELPVEFVQLHQVLNPLYILSKQLEKATTRLPHVIPLVRKCISEWKHINEIYEGPDEVQLFIDYLFGNLLTRLRANAYEEAVTAYVLSLVGKDEIHHGPRSSSDTSSSNISEEKGDCDGPNASTDFVRSSSSSESEELMEDELETVFQVPETATKRRRDLMELHKSHIASLSLTDKLNYDLMYDYLAIAHESLSQHGSHIEDDDGGEDYYLVGLTKWIDTSFEQTISSLKLFETCPDEQLDVCLWHHILHLSRGHAEWTRWKAFSETAIRFVLAGTSEAAVERLLSVQKQIQ